MSGQMGPNFWENRYWVAAPCRLRVTSFPPQTRFSDAFLATLEYTSDNRWCAEDASPGP